MSGRGDNNALGSIIAVLNLTGRYDLFIHMFKNLLPYCCMKTLVYPIIESRSVFWNRTAPVLDILVTSEYKYAAELYNGIY